MDAFHTNIISFFKQNIIHKLLEEAHQQNLPVTHPAVSATVVSHFNLGPVHHVNFEMLVLQLVQTL